MKKYLKDLEAELRKNNLNEKEIEEILADHEEMIESAINEGLTDEELIEKFGDPKEVAEMLSDFSEKKEETESQEKIKEYVFENIQENYSIKIELINEDYEFKLIYDNKIKVDLIGDISPRKYEIDYRNNTLLIKTKHHFQRLYFESNKEKKFVISIPKDILIDEFIIKEINGDGKIEGFRSRKTNIETNNGDMVLENIITDEFKLGYWY